MTWGHGICLFGNRFGQPGRRRLRSPSWWPTTPKPLPRFWPLPNWKLAESLAQAGLRAAWLECSVRSQLPKDPCQKAPEATGIRMRILPAPVLDKFQDSVFGFAVHPVLASVYYEYRVERRARVTTPSSSSRLFWVASWPTNSATCCWARTVTPTRESCSRGGKRIRFGS